MPTPPFLGRPPDRRPMPAAQAPALRGKRVVLSRPDGFVYDMRAVSEVYTDHRGQGVVDICSEQAFYRWMLTGVDPSREVYPVTLVWTD